MVSPHLFLFSAVSTLFLLSILATISPLFLLLSLPMSSHSSGTVTNTPFPGPGLQEKLKTDRTNFLLIGAQEIAPHFNFLPHSQIDM